MGDRGVTLGDRWGWDEYRAQVKGNCRLPKCLLYFSPKSTYFFIIVSSVCFGVILRETLPPGDYINRPLQFFLLFLVGFFFLTLKSVTEIYSDL